MPLVNDDSAAATEKEEGCRETEKWFIEMRGWIMVLAVQITAFTYQAGLNPPGRFSEDNCKAGTGLNPPPGRFSEDNCTFWYRVFFYTNTTAFLTSLAIIILLMNRSFYRSFVKVTVLEVIVVLDMMGLMAAYLAGSTGKHQTTSMFAGALVLTALVLFAIYVVYAVQLVHKLRALFDAARRRVPARGAARRDDDGIRTPSKLELQLHHRDD